MTKNTIQVFIIEAYPLTNRGIKEYLAVDNESRIEIVGEAFNCMDALEKVRHVKPDILLVGFAPGICGLEDAKELGQAVSGLRMLLYCYDDLCPQDLCHLLSSGIWGYILRSASPQQLLKAIELLSQGNIYFEERFWQHLIAHPDASSRTDAEKCLASLWPREKEVFKLLAQNRTKDEIARELKISRRTVEKYQTQILKKCQVKTPFGLITPEIVKILCRWANQNVKNGKK